MDDAARPGLVGRAREREAIAAALREWRCSVVAIEGEPGIGKSRLLGHLAASAAAGGATVLGARASEFESDLPYALWTEALDGHLADLGERRVSRLGLADPAGLEAVLPAFAGATSKAATGDRHRMHRALRDLLERLAAARRLVLWMDDVHWADPASLDAMVALVSRPPTAPALLAVAAREGRLPDRLALALAGAQREDRALALRLEPLSEAEAAELVGEARERDLPADGRQSVLPRTGRARTRRRTARSRRRRGIGAARRRGGTGRRAVGARAARAPDARRRRRGGRPVRAALAAAVAELDERAALHALDELLDRALVRPAEGARRFAFRHPIVRHAVYAATPPGWRLGAHARAAAELARRGAGPVERARHVEHAARPGDEDAIALLSAAATELQSPAPATAAHYHGAALRLLPDAQRERRARLQRLRADAQAAAGDPQAARETLLDALASAPPGDRLVLTVALANQEWWLGGHADAGRRLHVALGELPAQPSPDRSASGSRSA